MPITRIQNLDDRRLEVYREIRNSSLVRNHRKFIAEGWRVVDRMLDQGIEVESILISERKAETLGPKFTDHADVFVLSQPEAETLIGYNFHAGILACGLEPANADLEHLVRKNAPIVCCPNMTRPDNLGSLIRLAAGFGMAGLLVGSKTADPYLRRVIRVSMGTIFSLPIRVSDSLERDLDELKRLNFKFIAAESTDTSIPLDNASRDAFPSKSVLLLGNEAEGLNETDLARADERLHIPMAEGVDSLNVTYAAAIFMYEMMQARSGNRD